MTKYLWTLMICAALGVSSSACGADDDDDDMGGGGGSAGMTSGTGGGGSGGSGGRSGSGAAGSTATSVPCGTTVCTAPMAPAFIPANLLPAPCCLPTNMCGQSMGGAACAPPPPPAVNDPRCPPLMLGPLNVPGCCMNNDCGINASMIGLGCMVNTGGMASGLPLPAARKCDAPPDPMMMGDDAGI